MQSSINQPKSSVKTFARLSIGIFKFVFSSMVMLAVTMGVANATSPVLQPSTSVPADNATGVATNTNSSGLNLNDQVEIFATEIELK